MAIASAFFVVTQVSATTCVESIVSLLMSRRQVETVLRVPEIRSIHPFWGQSLNVSLLSADSGYEGVPLARILNHEKACFGASPSAAFSVEVQSMVSDCFPRIAAIGREFPQIAGKASASLTEGRGPKYKGSLDLRYLLAAISRERSRTVAFCLKK